MDSPHKRGDTVAPTLVIGAGGKTGRRVAARLVDGGHQVRRGSRSGEPRFDWEDRDTWADALAGVGAAYVSYYPDLALPGAAEAVGDLARQAVESGVRRLVLLSGRGEPGALAAEHELAASGAEWTVLRCSWFAQNFSEGYLLDPVLAGEVALPVAAVGEPFVDLEDVADVALAALTGEGHAGQVYELTGPRLLTFAEAVGEIATAAGRPVAFAEVTMPEFLAGLREAEVPAEFGELLEHLFTEVLDGRNAELADGVERALGREPRDFSAYATAAAAAGAWRV